ncbi:phosphoenolpyruvate synthase [Rhodococcus fascians]|nr:phosphoenolpyruvate synthase [Rhodococcus fascians]MBY4069747.1 phosphoenolpyruvate synthase [Rhodococcus fascians]
MAAPASLTEADSWRIGGKAQGLLRLNVIDARVPDWVVVDTSAFAAHLDRSDVGGLLRARIAEAVRVGAIVSHVNSLAEELSRAIISTDVDELLASDIAEAVAAWGSVAVRSSAVGEDGADRSYAGIFETHLYCGNLTQVLDGLRRCWASAFSSRARDYHGAAAGPTPEVAVILQEMADGEVSGVLFTIDPVRGSTRQAALSACWGLGEGIVSGLCATDEYAVHHDGYEVEITVADKDVEVLRAVDGGVREVEISGPRRTERCLTQEQTALLVTEGLRIARALGSPQDIEWTLRGGVPVVLQTRPITASTLRVAALGQWRTVWDNSNIQESFNGVTLPLTFSWASRVYEVIFTETLRMIGVSNATVIANEKVLRNMVGLISGRVYYNINNWYRVLRLAPFFDRNKEDVERMIGVENPVDFIEGIHTSIEDRLVRIPQLAPVLLVLGWRMANRGRLVDRFQWEVGAEVTRIRDQLHDLDDLDELLDLSEMGLKLFDRWAVQILNDLYLSNQAGRARRILARSGNHSSEEVIAGLLASEEAVESLQPTLILMRLASTIGDDSRLSHILLSSPPERTLQALRLASPMVRAVLDDYIDLYGDRCMGEQKLETISLRQDPSFIASILRNYVRDESIDVNSFVQDQALRQSEFEERILSGLPRRRRKNLLRALRRARTAVRDRERMRLTRTRIVGVGRSIYLKVGETLHAAGQLDNPRDVFYLTMGEIQAFAEGRSVTSELQSLVRDRIDEFAGYELTEPPNQFETSGPPYGLGLQSVSQVAGSDLAGNAIADEAHVFRGTGCWPGTVEGQVQVVMSPSDDLDVRGKIMTTLRTDPGWGPLFPSVAGLLIERGSTLSHSAVLARELGIPAVVGVRDLMARVRDGERVRLDGGSGIVERLDDLG